MKPLYFSAYILLFLFVLSCSKEVSEDYSKTKIIGHGGAGFPSTVNPYPTNSFISIQKAIEGYGIDGVDVDIQMDSENNLWLFHDDLLEISTNCNGCLYDNKSEYIENCRYKNLIGSELTAREKLVQLESLLEHYYSRQDKPLIFLDIKLNDCFEADEMSLALMNIIEQYDAYTWTQVNCTSEDFLIKFREYSGSFEIIYQTIDIDDGIAKCIDNNFDGITSHTDNITKELVDQCHQSGLSVTIYGVGSKKDITEALDKNPDQLITDNIELTLNLMNR